MVFYSNKLKNKILVSDSECYKYVRESNDNKMDFIVSTVDLNGSRLSKKVTKKEFDNLMCRMVEYK